MKALDVMKSAASVTERADAFVKTIRRNLQKSILDPLIDKKEKLEDEIASNLDFTLNVDLNKGLQLISRNECESRFAKVQKLEYELTLLNLEIKEREKIYDKYFSNEDKS